MRGWIGKLVRLLVYTSATIVIVLALLVGLVRLLLPLVPEYQEQVRLIATQATGLDVEFERISASWPLRGPEVKLFDVRLLNPLDQSPVLAAREVTVGIALLGLLTEGTLSPSRVGASGARLELERSESGEWTIQGRAPADWLPTATTRPRRVPEIDVVLEEIELLYRDGRPGGVLLPVLVENLELRIETDAVTAEGRLELADGTAGQLRIDAVLDGPLPASADDFVDLDWKLSLDARDLDLPLLLSTALRAETPLRAAQGDLRLAAKLRGARPRNVAAELEFADVTLATVDGSSVSYPRLEGKFEWASQMSGWLFAASDLTLSRDAGGGDLTSLTVTARDDPDTAARVLNVSAGYLPMADLYPLVLAVVTPAGRAGLLPDEFRGELRDLQFTLSTQSGLPAQYSLAVSFSDLGAVNAPGGITAAGLSGQVVGDQDGGRLEIDSRGLTLALPAVFAAPVGADRLNGFLIWRMTDDDIRVLSDSIEITTPRLSARTRLELTLPRSGGSPFLDLEGTASGDAAAVVPYLPLRKFPPAVTDWLQRAVLAGNGTGSVQVRGALREFPYDHGEGLFRVELNVQDAVLDYADRWPAVENLSGQFVFDGVSLSTVTNAGSIAGLPLTNRPIRLADLRKGILDIGGEQVMEFDQLLTLLRATPVAAMLGPVADRAIASGPVATRLKLSIPVLRPAEYSLDARMELLGGSLGLEGVNFDFDDLRGVVNVRNTRVDADALSARLLDQPVSIKLRSASRPDSAYRQYALVTGAIPPRRWMETFDLPRPDLVEGNAQWRAMALIPTPGLEGGRQLRILVRSDLAGAVSRWPDPLAKDADSLAPLKIDIAFPEEGLLRVDGRLRDGLTWALRLKADEQGWRVERGLVNSDLTAATLPELPGVELRGRLQRLRIGDWLDLMGSDGDGLPSLYREATLAVTELSAFGELFLNTELAATRDGDEWRIKVSGEEARGVILVPPRADPNRPLRLDMERLWLRQPDTGATDTADPRLVPSVDISVADFAIGDLRFGRLKTRIEPLEDGAAVRDIDVDGGSFVIRGEGDWRVLNNKLEDQRSSLRATLRSSDVADTLQRLAYGTVIQGRSANATGNINWPGPPSAGFLDYASGAFSFKIDEGTLLDLDPGGGRLLGILSVAALPRRLALDFSDVVDEGLGFDTLQGDFSLEAGNAYTCNLGLEGSVADLGIVGRTGLRDRDYDQLAVVRPHVSNVLALGGAVVAGPGVGAAMFLLSQIFRKPLSQLGETYYRVTGPWEQSVVERVQRTEVDASRFANCERYLAEVVPEASAGGELATEPGTELPVEIVP